MLDVIVVATSLSTLVFGSLQSIKVIRIMRAIIKVIRIMRAVTTE